MPEQAAKLLHFTNAVIREAQIETRQSMRALEKLRFSVLSKTRERVHAEVQEHIKDETARIQADAGREISRHLMECKREIYLRRTQISQEVFAQVTQRLREFTASPEYGRRLEQQFSEAIGKLGLVREVTVLLRPEDMHFAPQLEQSVKPVSVRFQEGGFTLGGVTVLCPEAGRSIDATYDTALEDLSGHFAERFGLSLSDDLAET